MTSTAAQPGVRKAELQLFGWWELRVGETSVPVGGREQRLIALLALTGRQSRAHVAGTLWPDTTEHRAMNSLRAAVWRTRHATTGVLTAQESTLGLAADVAVDATDLVRRASTVVAAPDLARSVSLDLLETKDLLPGWYDDWVLFERARIEHVRFRALEAMALERLRAGWSNDAAVAARAALRIEPLHEGANLLLIQACLDSGGTVEAVRHFHDYRRRLELELGIRPSPPLHQLIAPLLVPRQRGAGR